MEAHKEYDFAVEFWLQKKHQTFFYVKAVGFLDAVDYAQGKLADGNYLLEQEGKRNEVITFDEVRVIQGAYNANKR